MSVVMVRLSVVLTALVVVGTARGGAAERDKKRGDGRPDESTFKTVVAPFLAKHCRGCHGAPHAKGDLRLDVIDGDLVHGKDAARWKEVYDRLNRGEMPPSTEARPQPGEVEKVVSWILVETRRAEREARSTGGRAILRRMSRAEYANTVRDLLHVRFLFDDGPANLLPPDGTVGGFDKVGSGLTIDPALLSQYLTVARRVADAAVVTGGRPFEARRRRFEYEDTARSDAIGYECNEPHISCRPTDLVLMDGQARTWDHLRLYPEVETAIPTSGMYTIRVRMSANVSTRGTPLKAQLVWPSDTVIAEWTLTQQDRKARVFAVTIPIKPAGKAQEGPQIRLIGGTRFYLANELRGGLQREADRMFAAGDGAQAAKIWALAKAEGAASSMQPNPAIGDRTRLPSLSLDWIELEGPLLGEWPPRTHQDLFFEGSLKSKDLAQNLAYAGRIFERFLPRAYRRPVTAADVKAAVLRVERELRAGESLEEAVKVGLQYVLSSPKFLYLVEPERGADERLLDDFELASRVSYFLWSSMPDDQLFELARKRRLRSPGVLEDQVQRMLQDEKARAFVDGFGAQWLQASRFVGVPPNRQIYRDWDDELEIAVKREPLAFFEEVVRGDRSVLDFLDSDFVMVNERLARHYGIAGVVGNEFRRVKLPPNSHRGGLITQAAVLTIGSDGTRTLPVRRAAWILQTLFNDPPPPPPPNVREVEPNTQGKRLTVRERLILHQKIPACASCHAKIDPYGLALESYDGVGAWRTRQNGEEFGPHDEGAPPIDASGTLPDGRSFRTTAQFRALVRDYRARFSHALAELMLTYALGRTLESGDGDTVEALVRTLAEHSYRISALVTAIVKSRAFGTR